MKVKILKTAVGDRFAVYEGETRELDNGLAIELIRAGIAAVIRTRQKQTAIREAPERAIR